MERSKLSSNKQNFDKFEPKKIKLRRIRKNIRISFNGKFVFSNRRKQRVNLNRILKTKVRKNTKWYKLEWINLIFKLFLNAVV